MRSSLFVPLFLLAGVRLGVASKSVFAAPLVIPKSKSPAYEAVRVALFIHLEKQAKAKAQLPAFPSQKLLRWVENRHAAVDENSKARYALLFEHLLIAQKLLESADLATRKQGFRIANESANFAAAHLKKDKWLLARIYEGFLLPQVSLANAPMWQSPSRGRVIEAGVSAFGGAKERDKQIKVLQWLLLIGEKSSAATADSENKDALALETNTLDWARGTLAAVLFEAPNAKRSDLERAVSLLQAIESPDMKGFKNLQTRVQDRLTQLQLKDLPHR